MALWRMHRMAGCVGALDFIGVTLDSKKPAWYQRTHTQARCLHSISPNQIAGRVALSSSLTDSCHKPLGAP